MKKYILYLLLLKKIIYISLYPYIKDKSRISHTIKLGMENYLIFQPAKFRATKVNRNLLKKFQTVRFMTLDGARLFAWFVPPQENKPTIIYFHGQAESILMHQNIVEFGLKNGYGVFLLSYRGHYRSWGIPSEAGVYRDAETALDWLEREAKIKAKDIILWGHSLGTTIAANTALNNKVKALILQSPITDIETAAKDMAKFYIRKIRILPKITKFVQKHMNDIHFIQKFDTINKIPKIKCPIFLCHSKVDKVAPSKNSRALYERNINAQLFLSDKGSHWDSAWCMDKIADFIKNLR